MYRIWTVCLFLFCGLRVFSQSGASINSTGAAPHPSAMLDVSSNQSGFLLPRMTAGERDAISSPAQGLLIFNTTSNCLEIYLNPVWQSIYCGCTPPLAPGAGSHSPAANEIVWNWNAVSGASGYRYNTVNDYASATPTSGTSYTQTGLTCGTPYTLYVWAISSTCGYSSPTTLTASTGICSSCNVSTLTDIDGNVYNTVSIGSQCWMKENLKVTKSASGGAITRYCHDCVKYGGHYNWATIMNGQSSSNAVPSGVQGICPIGWHLPSQAEFAQMVNYLKTNGYHCGSDVNWVAKAVANSSGWAANPWSDPQNCTPANYQAANNSSGFSMVGGGYWNPTMSQYYQSAETIVANIHEGYIWTATQSSGSDATFFRIGQYYYEPGFTDYTKNGRGNVRCVED